MPAARPGCPRRLRVAPLQNNAWVKALEGRDSDHVVAPQHRPLVCAQLRARIERVFAPVLWRAVVFLSSILARSPAGYRVVMFGNAVLGCSCPRLRVGAGMLPRSSLKSRRTNAWSFSIPWARESRLFAYPGNVRRPRHCRRLPRTAESSVDVREVRLQVVASRKCIAAKASSTSQAHSTTTTL